MYILVFAMLYSQYMQLNECLTDEEILFLNQTFNLSNCTELNSTVLGASCVIANSRISELYLDLPFSWNQKIPDTVTWF